MVIDQDEIRQHRDAAFELVAAGKQKRAADIYLLLVRLEPHSGDWARRGAECFRQLGMHSEQTALLLAAARAYGAAGHHLKALAMCKLAHKTEPDSAEVKAAFAHLAAIDPTSASPSRLAPHLKAPPTERLTGRPPPSSVAAEDDNLASPMTALAALDLENNSAFAALGSARLFENLTEVQRARLAESVELIELHAGERLFEQGAAADSMYVVVDGEVLALAREPLGAGMLELACLSAGDFFGEIGLLGEQPRQASIVARSETVLLRFGREPIVKLGQEDPEFLRRLLGFLHERLVETFMLTSLLFAPFGEYERASLRRLFRFVELTEGSVLVSEGESSDALYVLVSGQAIVQRVVGEQLVILGLLGPGDVFGEMSLLNRQTAMASVTVCTRAFALKLPGRLFMEVLMTHPLLLEHVATLGATRREQNDAVSGTGQTLGDDHVALF